MINIIINEVNIHKKSCDLYIYIYIYRKELEDSSDIYDKPVPFNVRPDPYSSTKGKKRSFMDSIGCSGCK